MRSIYCVFIALASFFAKNASAQKIDINRATQENTEWSEGVVTLNDGKTLSGQIKLNSKTGLLAYESGATSRTFNPRNILGFSYFDVIKGKTLNFLSVTYKSDKPKNDGALAGMRKDREKATSEMGIPMFCEILVECKTFALLSTLSPMNIEQSNGSPMGVDPVTGIYILPSSSSTTYTQTETLLILDMEGKVTPVLDITNSETDRLIFDDKETRHKKRNKSVLEDYTEPYYEQLKDYAKERKLSFRKRDDLILIIDHYNALSAD